MKNKNKPISAFLGFAASVALLVFSIYLAEEKILSSVTSAILITAAAFFTLTTLFCTAKADYNLHVYKCKKCSHIFKPTFGEYFRAPHSPTKRLLRCPKCKEKTWCKQKAI